MTSVLLHDCSPTFGQGADRDVDTIRALCHDLRQPLAAIQLLAAAESGDVRRRLDGIMEQAKWLADMVDEVLVGAKSDRVDRVDVSELAELCVHRAQPTADCTISCAHDGQVLGLAAPVALSRALGCLIDNAARAAGPGGRVVVSVVRRGGQVFLSVVDDGPGLGHVVGRTSLGLTITRALVAACGGRFELLPGRDRGVVACITLPDARPEAVAS